MSAAQIGLRLIIASAALLLVAVIVTGFLQGSSAVRPAVPVVMVGGFILICYLALRMQRRIFQELQAGYTTVQLQFGIASRGRWRQSTTGASQPRAVADCAGITAARGG